MSFFRREPPHCLSVTSPKAGFSSKPTTGHLTQGTGSQVAAATSRYSWGAGAAQNDGRGASAPILTWCWALWRLGLHPFWTHGAPSGRGESCSPEAPLWWGCRARAGRENPEGTGIQAEPTLRLACRVGVSPHPRSLIMRGFLKKILFYLFLESGEGREKQGEKRQCVVTSRSPPTGDLACNPGMCPD